MYLDFIIPIKNESFYINNKIEILYAIYFILNKDLIISNLLLTFIYIYLTINIYKREKFLV